MSRLQAIFKADGEETRGAYSVSEWWLQANSAGPPVHDHPEDHVFYVIEGTMAFCLDGDWLSATRGSYLLIPGGTPFENRSDERLGFISFNQPGGFEQQAQPIADWFADNPLGDARHEHNINTQVQSAVKANDMRALKALYFHG